MQSGPVADMARETLADSHLIRDGYLDKKAYEVVMREFEKDGSHSKLMWKLFIAEQWYQSCLR